MASGAPHLVHGMGLALEAPAWPAITRAEATETLKNFPQAGALTDLHWHSPRPFSAAALIETTKGEYILKRHHHTVRTPENLAQEHAFIAHLRASLPVPEVIPAADGRSTVAHNEWTYELHRKSPGADLYREATSWTPFASTDHAHAAGTALAKLHLAAQGFDAPRRPPQPLVGSLTILTTPDPTAGAARYVAARPALAAFLAKRPSQDLDDLLLTLGASLPERLANQPQLWTHNDWHASNLLWSPTGEVSTIFDFGLADRTCAVHDLATGIERCAIAWLHMTPARDNPIGDVPTARALIAGYRTVLPIDRETVIALLPLVHIEFALSEIDYFAGNLSDPAQAQQAWDDYLIGHANWFRSAAGRTFLKAIA